MTEFSELGKSFPSKNPKAHSLFRHKNATKDCKLLIINSYFKITYFVVFMHIIDHHGTVALFTSSPFPFCLLVYHHYLDLFILLIAFLFLVLFLQHGA